MLKAALPAGQHLLPFANLRMQRGLPHHGDDQRRTGGARRSSSRTLGSALGFLLAKSAASSSLALTRASPEKTTKRHGVSLPWSGTREAMVRISAIWLLLGPGGPRKLAETDLRVFRSSRASGMAYRVMEGCRADTWPESGGDFNPPGRQIGLEIATEPAILTSGGVLTGA